MSLFAWIYDNRIKAALGYEHELTERAAIRADREAYDRVFHPDLERIIYSGDHPHCPACVVDWEDNHITPCPDYPACSIPAPTGRHRLTWTEAEL